MIRPANPALGAVARLLAPLAVLLALFACKPAPPPELPGAAAEPAAVVRNLAELMRNNDLPGYARAAVSAADYLQLQAAWNAGLSRWPLSELPMDEKLLPLLQALSAPGAETKLKADFDAQLANQNNDLRDAARSLGLFGVKYVQQQADYDAEQKKHYAAVIAALSKWAQKAPLGDPSRAHVLIDKLCAAARATGIGDDAALARFGMDGSLQRLAPFVAALKDALASGYGLDLDASLTDLRSGLQQQDGDTATVLVEYPLAAAQIQALAHLQRRDGRWYLASTLAETGAILAKLPPPSTASAATPASAAAVSASPAPAPAKR